MKNINYKRNYFMMDIILISILFFSVINNFEKPYLSTDFLTEEKDEITKINGIELNPEKADYELEYIIDQLPIGTVVVIEYSSEGNIKRISKELEPYYGFFFAIIFVLTLLIFLYIGIYIIRERYNEPVSRIFHNVVFAAAFLIGLTWGRINLFDNPIDVLLRILYDFSYVWLGVNMLHFSLVFPREKISYSKNLIVPLYIFVFVITAFISYLHYPAIVNNSIEDFRYYLSVQEVVIPLIFVILISAAIVSFMHSYKSYKTSYDRQQIRWILVGVIVAPMSFILLWLLPRKLLGFPLIPEWLMLLFTTLAPVSFYISIFKYRIFNIDIILSRSSVYSAVIIVVIGFYIILQKLLEYLIFLSREIKPDISNTFTGIIENPNLPVFISFFLIILFYGTLKQKFQNFVDRRLFSETFRQKQANDEFSDELSKAITANEIGNLSFSYLVETLKTEKLGIIIFDLDTNNVIFSRFSTMIDIPKGFHRSMSKFLKDCSIRVAAKENTIEKGYKLSTTDELLVTIEDMNVYLFSFSNDRSKVALTMFGDNSKHFRYSHEEIDAALFKTDRAISNISRLFIMSHLTMKEEQNKQLEELSDMKSYFISSVTHELKTPLTSIKIFAELMQNSEDISNKDKNKYLEIIQYECSRLNNLINNVLDFSKIERGVKEYNFANVDLVHIIDLVMTMMQFQFERAGFKIEKDIAVSNAVVYADKDAVSEVIINLLSNSMKYSDDEKYIKVSLSAQNGNFVLSVEDKGNGIPLEDQKHIFDAFYRAESAKKGPTGGAGIGLSLVKSIIDAHNGDIKLNSIPGEGTKIDIYIPKGENDE